MNNKQKTIRTLVFCQNTVAGITAISEKIHK